MNNNLVLISGAILYKEHRGKKFWFLVKQGQDGGWEIPKVLVRRVESSVRAAIRMMGEQGGMSVRVLEEAGRAGGVANINGKVLPQRHLYYLMTLLAKSEEGIGFDDCLWLEYAKAVRKLSSKREKQMLRQANKVLRAWEKEEREKDKKLQVK